MMMKINIVIPCYNEEQTIEKVIKDFHKELPNARIVVVNNNSNDNTRRIALKAGAEVFFEKKQGKGYAVQKAFDIFNEDIFVLVDGDDTYFAGDIKKLLQPILDQKADMVVGNRMHKENLSAFSTRHWYGNKFLNYVLNFLFHTHINDMQSGLRVMSKDFVNSTALLAGGFSIEPELTIQAIEKDMIIKEIPIILHKRPNGSHSKINTVRDGTIALYTLLSLFRDYKPLHFFSILSFVFLVGGIVLGWMGVSEYFEQGTVSRMPSLVVAGFLIIAALVSIIAGLILSSIKRRHDELAVILRRMREQNK